MITILFVALTHFSFFFSFFMTTILYYNSIEIMEKHIIHSFIHSFSKFLLSVYSLLGYVITKMNETLSQLKGNDSTKKYGIRAESMSLKCAFWLCYIIAGWFWTCYLTTLRLRFLTYKRQKVMSTSQIGNRYNRKLSEVFGP